MFKRTVDITFSVLLLTITLPFLAFAAAIIKLDSEGPVIFRQIRMGRKFRRFQLFKLRTMNIGGDGPAYTLGADPRITRAGYWLRKFKVDELPQLWNVFRGEMSLVGPRPVIPELAMEFDWAYTRLLKVRPGLTDPASLKYCNETEILAGVLEPLRYFKTVVTPDKIRISQAYLQRANPWTDLGVAVSTGFALVSPSLRRRFSRQIRQGPDESARLLFFPETMRIGKGEAIFEDAPIQEQFEIPVAVMERARRTQGFSGGESMPI